MDLDKLSKILFGMMISVVVFTFAFLIWYLGNGGQDCLVDPVGFYKLQNNISNYNCSCFMPLK